MDVAMSSSVTLEPPPSSLLLRSGSVSPQRARTSISARHISQQQSSRSDLSGSLPLSTEMDPSNSAPQLSAANPQVSDTDTPMTDVETSLGESTVNGEASDAVIERDAVVETDTDVAAPQQISNGSADGTLNLPQENPSSTEPEHTPQGNTDSTPPPIPFTAAMDALIAIVNGSTAGAGDAMDTTETDVQAQGIDNAPAEGSGDPPPTDTLQAGGTQPQPPSIAPPPPLPAPSAATNPVEHVYSESSSDGESDDETLTRADFVEDTSAPDEEELKEIESLPEVAGTDHDHFEYEFFHELDDPEHTPGETGRIHWTVTKVRGTWERPNRQAVMKSPSVRIGDLNWNIKLYPRGNETDHLSVYLEASRPRSTSESSMSQSEANEGSTGHDGLLRDSSGSSLFTESIEAAPPGAAESNAALTTASTPETSDADMSGSGDGTSAPSGTSSSEESEDDTDWGVPVQFGIVMYNPSEPRVHVSQAMEHRFCRGSSDWGATRFYGPHDVLRKRQRGQRQAMLRNDTLAFTAYIRIINDDTQTLFQGSVFDREWNSLAKTGLRSLSSKRSGGSFAVAAIASWVLLAPIREIIHGTTTADPLKEQRLPPKGLVIALQRVTHRLQSQQKPSTSPVSLSPITDFFSALGIGHCFSFDVVEFWELLRHRLEAELKDTGMDGKLNDLFDGSFRRGSSESGGQASRDTMDISVSAGKPPSFRLPIQGMRNVQIALAKFLDGVGGMHKAIWQKLPKVMHIELQRQVFDQKSRKWEKLVDKVKINETIDVAPWTSNRDAESRYTLYGLIVHDGHLRSGLYHPVIRPGGPGTRWYAYLHEHDVDRVVCQTRKQAVENNQGVSSRNEKEGTEPVAYVLMYVRNDVIGEVLQGVPEQPSAPQWIREEAADAESAMDDSAVDIDEVLQEPVDLRIFRSDLFEGYSDLGIFNLYKSTSVPVQSKQILDLTFQGKDTVAEVQKHLANVLECVEDPHQCHLFRFDSLAGCQGRPVVKLAESTALGRERLEWPQMQFWLHVVPREGFKGDAVSNALPTASATHAASSVPDAAVASSGRHLAGDAPSSSEDRSPRDDTTSAAIGVQGTSESLVAGVVSGPISQNETLQPSGVEDTVMVDAPETASASRVSEIEVPGDDMDIEITQHEEPSTNPTAPVPEPMAQPDMAENGTDAPQNAVAEVSPPTPESIYFFVKRFNVTEQTLRGLGSYLAQLDDDIFQVVSKMLGITDDDDDFDLWEEFHTDQTRELVFGQTFRDQKLSNGAVLVVIDELPESTLYRVQGDGGRHSLASYLSFCCYRNEAIHPLDGMVDRKYFSDIAYSGLIKNGQLHGHGTMTDFNGDTYEGDFVAGRREGQGRLEFQNHDVYEGEWKDGLMNGEGKLVYAKTGNTYVGGFKTGRRHGRGRMDYLVAEDDQQLCQICYEEDMDCLFYDCGHVCACLRCAKQLESCPVCRKAVKSVVKMYRT